MSASSSTELRDPLIGTRIDGRYRVQGVLGRGGMGVVYDGVHEQLGREVAIKVLGAAIANDPTAIQRFLREARTASQLTHGNIVDVSDLGALPDGRPYLVMAKLHGTDLWSLVQEHGPQTPQRAAQLLRGAAAALDLIHAKGFVHRDVKPENLMHVVREDGSEAVLLLDFGIVGLVRPDNTRLTAAGVLFGTPAYIAPEVIRGAVPTAQADIYALAVVAFELMTGLLPFRSDNAFELMHAKLAQPAPRLSGTVALPISESVERVMAVALDRDPASRHASAGAFIAALDAAVLGEAPALPKLDVTQQPDMRRDPSLAATVPSQPLEIQGALHPYRRYRAWLLAISGALLVVVFVWSQLPRSPAPTLRAVVEPAPALPPSAAGSTAALLEPEPVVAQPAPVLPTPAPARKPATRKPAPAPVAPVAEAPSGPSAAELVRAAQNELVAGHLGQAASLYREATLLDPRSAAAFRGLGLVNERLGHQPEAARALRRAIALAPGDASNALLEERARKLETQTD